MDIENTTLSIPTPEPTIVPAGSKIKASNIEDDANILVTSDQKNNFITSTEKTNLQTLSNNNWSHANLANLDAEYHDIYDTGSYVLYNSYHDTTSYSSIAAGLDNADTMKEMQLDRSARGLKVYYQYRGQPGAWPPPDFYFNIYKNTTSIGTQRQTNSTDSWIVTSESIVDTFVPGDYVRIKGATSTITKGAQVKNFKVMVDEARKVYRNPLTPKDLYEMRDIGREYLAEVNGEVVVRIESNTHSGYVRGYLGSASANIQTCNDNIHQTYHIEGGFTMPVKKGYYWKITTTNVNLGINVRWYPFY
jgi:hypothetical protein